MSAVVEQMPYGFRYRVAEAGHLVASSPVFPGLDICLYALANRFPGLTCTKIEVLG